MDLEDDHAPDARTESSEEVEEVLSNSPTEPEDSSEDETEDHNANEEESGDEDEYYSISDDYKEEQSEENGSEASVAGDSSDSALDGLQSNMSDQADSPSVSRARKRPASAVVAYLPFKRRKGYYNADYLDLLNRDIEDAASRVVLDENFQLPNSQLGLTIWSSSEKTLFFEALSRLGKDDLPGIASRIQTKSVVEIRAYIHILERAVDVREKGRYRPALMQADFPTAVELSHSCCHVLEIAADAISVRQQQHEESMEQKKWGKNWNITPAIGRRISDLEMLKHQEHPLQFAQLFRPAVWLTLSERFFMNSSIQENCWRSVEEQPPSMRATAFQDFHSLAVVITKRLVLAAMYVSMSRIRAKRAVVARTKNLVRRKDVEAAVASMGLKRNSQKFWATCARRLRLDVYENPPLSRGGAEDEPMPYDEVEKVLGLTHDERMDTNQDQTEESSSPSPDSEESASDNSDAIDDDDSRGSDDSADSDIESPDPEISRSTRADDEDLEIEQEAKEILLYSGMDFPFTAEARTALKTRIRNERAQEAYADAVDVTASYDAEVEMWKLLGREPPEPLVKPDEPEGGSITAKLVGGVYPGRKDWRKSFVYRSEWEGPT
jgi:RNA polymerase I-specific transcription initiation factor RRN5